MSRRKLPEIPNASLADIAFMVLIFFLMVSTMDTDMGLERRLPPMPPPDQIDDDTPPIKERNVFVVLVNAQNQLLVEGEWLDIKNLREKAKEFIANPDDDPNLPEKTVQDIPFFGPTPVTKGVISLQNHVGTQYGTYIAVQSELVGAINDLRKELALQKFGKPYESLDSDQQGAIKDIYPSKISEAEPKKIGGGK
ncbi:MAG: biopolymer transporter ExbD [Bacteroidetes bacterium GWF2_42_66]|nr:MAG: biopolymer transporter ExbD [Bacteroidetes bacterium GWA2_42_15]OFX98356.1 MAG: biopolymer transporter ExbD [Bacteroidetes bacterium GWE2_42_39]OFY42741.1 MAG: biopolymer transporter ExbD [Bacteroidetes bacterium GWF2_42_66]HBL74350.1 biopolymer transporter ExbD [Prolixibacteraceae bacterium]HCR91389.1 biopolymer transporter ExbD [Prolixibacteraceae bacterium]